MITYKFKLYRSKRNRYLEQQIRTAGSIYNHCIALHKRYYRMYGKSLNVYQLKKHLTKLKHLPKYAKWKIVGSQAIQDVAERIDRAYKLFFRNLKHHVKSAPPSFKKVRKYKSFTLKQSGYKLFADNSIRIQGRTYRYFKSREVDGKIKTITVKRDALGDIYIYIVCETREVQVVPRAGKIVGYDFGLKTFLKASDGKDIKSPEFFKQGQNEIKRLSRQMSSKKRGSNNRAKAKLALERAHKIIANKRLDFQFKLAKNLSQEYAVICIEDLNIKAMQRLWGKKVSDLSHSSFVQILQYQCSKTGSLLVKAPRFFPSTKTCHMCGVINETLTLKDRSWTCSNCGAHHDRDYNAAVNIKRVGASTLGVEIVRPFGADLVDTRIPCL